MKTKTIPFDLELAKKIQAGEIQGKIMYNKTEAKIIDFSVFAEDAKAYICASVKGNSNEYNTRLFLNTGNDVNDERGSLLYKLYLEVPDDEPQFKPFDRVLVREDESDVWKCRLFDRFFQNKGGLGYCCQDGVSYDFCIPYEGNEHLVGTTNKPKED